MKVLLDENMPQRMRLMIPDHEVYTVGYLGWKSTQNGALLRRAADAGFDVLISTDTGIQYEQNIAELPIAVILLRAKTNQLPDLIPLLHDVIIALLNLEPLSFQIIPSPS